MLATLSCHAAQPARQALHGHGAQSRLSRAAPAAQQQHLWPLLSHARLLAPKTHRALPPHSPALQKPVANGCLPIRLWSRALHPPSPTCASLVSSSPTRLSAAALALRSFRSAAALAAPTLPVPAPPVAPAPPVLSRGCACELPEACSSLSCWLSSATCKFSLSFSPMLSINCKCAGARSPGFQANPLLPFAPEL
jgi:hypothetical protein